jgi:small-conductance mechanosensitive channel
MVRGSRRLSKLILWEIILLFLLVLLITYGQKFFEIKSLNDILSSILPTALIILIVIVITKLFVTVLEPVFKRALQKYISPFNVKNTWQFISYLIWIIAFIILIILLFGILVGEQFNEGVAFLIGFIVVLFIFVSYRSIVNFIAWLQIIFSSPLKKGDLIEIDGIKGRIAEVTTSNIILEEKKEGLKDTGYTGRKISVPNYYIFTKPIASISSKQSVVWDEIKVLLPSNTNYLLAEDIMAEVAKSIVGSIMKKRRKEMLNKMTFTVDVPTVPTTEFSLEQNGVLITLRYFCSLSERAEVRSAISEGILKEFKKRKIQPKFEN